VFPCEGAKIPGRAFQTPVTHLESLSGYWLRKASRVSGSKISASFTPTNDQTETCALNDLPRKPSGADIAIGTRPKFSTTVRSLDEGIRAKHPKRLRSEAGSLNNPPNLAMVFTRVLRFCSPRSRRVFFGGDLSKFGHIQALRLAPASPVPRAAAKD